MPIFASAATELAQLLRSGTAGGLIPELMRQGLQSLIKAEAAAALGADRRQRTDQRREHRNGNRERLLAAPSGDIQLRIPRFRAGSFIPTLLEPRRRLNRALRALVMEAYVSGASTRKVDELVPALPGVNYVGGRAYLIVAGHGAWLRERHLRIGGQTHLPGTRRSAAGRCRHFWAGPKSSAASPKSSSMRRSSTAVTKRASW